MGLGTTRHRVGDWSVWDVEPDLQRPDNVYIGTEEGLKFSPDFGETWRQVSSDQLSGPIIAIAVNCNGTAVYVSDGESGVKAAFAEPAASIPLDETIGVEYGRFTSLKGDSRGGQPGDRGQSSNGDSRGDQPGGGGPSSEPTAAQVECMIDALGENVVAQFGLGGRFMSKDEEALIQHCF